METSKVVKYGSRSCSERCCDEGGNLPNTCGPGIVCAATDGMVAMSGGDVGVPLDIVGPADLSFADAEGTGR